MVRKAFRRSMRRRQLLRCGSNARLSRAVAALGRRPIPERRAALDDGARRRRQHAKCSPLRRRARRRRFAISAFLQS